MPKTEAQLKANKKYLEKLEVLYVRVTPEEKIKITDHAKSNGESANSFIKRAIFEAIEKEANQ